MPDDQSVGASGRGFNLPILLVGALAAGALFPHLSSTRNGSGPAAPAGRPVSSGPSAVAGLESDNEQVTTVLDKLADFFGVDITPKSLRRLVRGAPAALLNARTEAKRVEPATLLRAFFCMDVRRKPEGALETVWPLAGATPPPPDCRLPQPPKPPIGIAAVAQFVDKYFNDDARRDDVAVTRLALPDAPVQSPADEPKLLAKDFDLVNRGPLEWAVVQAAAARHQTPVQFLIATVPDPIDSYETWQFDPWVDAIRQGIEASGYLLDRFYLPDAEVEQKSGGAVATGRRDLHRHWPGIILFRWKKTTKIPNPTGTDNSLLVLFLVPETPVAGIHPEPFIRAVDFASGWMLRHPAMAPPGDPPQPPGDPALSPGRLRVLGPSFSGSTPSLVRALTDVDDLFMRRFPDEKHRPQITFVTGSASNDGNRKDFESRPPPRNVKVRFRATMQSNGAIARGSECFLREAGIKGPIAYLSEASTAYGSSREPSAVAKLISRLNRAPERLEECPANTGASNENVSIKFPFNVAELRNDESRDGAPRRDPAAAVIPGFRPLSLEDVTTPSDQLPLQTAKSTSSSVELVLSNLLDAIRRADVRIVNVDATDVRDKLFLVKEIRQRAPDVLVVTTDTDLFQIHPDQAPWLKGVIVASTYPLHSSSQNFAYPFRGYGAAARPNGELIQFPSVNMEGVYNAAIALLNYDIEDSPDADGKPQRFNLKGEKRFREEDVPRDGSGPFDGWPLLPRLIDYAGLGPRCPVTGEPAVWISAVGDGQIVPLRVYCGIEEQLQSEEPPAAKGLPASHHYVFRPKLAVAGQPPASTHQVPVTASTELLVGFLILGGVAACAGAWRARFSTSPATRGASALALCGLLVPMAFLSVTIPALTAEHIAAGEHGDAVAMAIASVICFAEVAFVLWYQVGRRPRSGDYLVPRGLFLAGSAACAVYAAGHLASSPQLFLQRTLDIGTTLSPLLPIVAFGLAPVIPAAVELWRLQQLGAAPPGANQVPYHWKRCLESISSWAAVQLGGLESLLVRSHQAVFRLPDGWMALPLAATILTAVIVFSVDSHPVLSIEGSLFGWGVVLVVLFLQWVYAAAVIRLAFISAATFQLLSRLARHPNDLPYGEVPSELSPIGLVPKPPRLQDLRLMAEAVVGGVSFLQADLDATPVPRWFQSVTWTVLQTEMERPLPSPLSGVDYAGLRAGRDRLAAMSVVFMVRELLSRLSVNLFIIGPVLALMTVLHATLYFDQSHCLLGLIWVDVLVAIVVVMTVFVGMDRDVVISRIRRTTPGQIDWNWDFVLKLLLYVVLPLLTLFATQFPTVGSGLIRLLEPVQRLPGN